jgi:hypothetical protein
MTADLAARCLAQAAILAAWSFAARGREMSESVCARAPVMLRSMILAADRGLSICGRGGRTVMIDWSGDGQPDLCADRVA